MSKLITTILLWLLRKGLMLLVIVSILLLGAWISSEWIELERRTKGIKEMEMLAESLQKDLDALDNKINEMAPDIAKMAQRLTDLNLQATRARNVKNRALTKINDEDGKLRNRLPGIPKSKEWHQANLEYEAKKIAADNLDRLVRNFQKNLQNSPDKPLILEKTEKENQVNELQKIINSDKSAIKESPPQRLMVSLRSQLPTALWILVGIMLTPVLIKVVFYYVMAPLAEKLPPISILPPTGSELVPKVIPSSVSLSIELEPDQEALVLSDYLQSSGGRENAKKHTQWFLNSRIPLSSIASGLILLTRVRPASNQKTTVVVSAQTDALGEVGIIELPTGSSMVIQPRSLVGAVKPQHESVQITRHWRLGSLHSWLTLQLRFLVFHGPCKLILKGCRGIVAEAPDSASGRMINQDATIGFSANLEYRNTRCETFISYFRGKESLFNDQFAGSPGLFIYEEMPASDRKTGITGRGMEGVVDAALKVFGI